MVLVSGGDGGGGRVNDASELKVLTNVGGGGDASGLERMKRGE